MRFPLLVPDIRELVEAGEAELLREFFEEQEPARLAELIEDFDLAEDQKILAVLETRLRAQVVSYLDPDRQVELVEAMEPRHAAELLHVMAHDDRADLVSRLDEARAESILRLLAHAEREDIRRLNSYESGTAGGVMTTDYVAFPPHITVREALERIRREAPDRETILTCYVVDVHRKLIGSLPLQRLVLARPALRVEDVMQEDPISAHVDDDQEGVARKIERYDLVAIPIVDAEGLLVGIVTHDDALDILEQEQSEDMLAFGGVRVDAESEDTSYWQGRVTRTVRSRVGWLMFLFAGGTVTGIILEGFGWVDKKFPAVAIDTFVPLLIGTGGNAGSQTVGTVIRAMALGEVEPRDFPRVLGREALTGLLLGTLLGAFGFIFAWLLRQKPPEFGLVIGLAVLGICVWANCVGAMVPLLARRFGIDPAVVSAPLISTLVDTTGLFIFYSIAIVVLYHLSY